MRVALGPTYDDFEVHVHVFVASVEGGGVAEGETQVTTIGGHLHTSMAYTHGGVQKNSNADSGSTA